MDAGGRVDWGHLSAGDTQFGAGSKQYELLADVDDHAGPSPQPPATAGGPMGRGRGMVLPEWMTQGLPAARVLAPGALPAPHLLQACGLVCASGYVHNTKTWCGRQL